MTLLNRPENGLKFFLRGRKKNLRGAPLSILKMGVEGGTLINSKKDASVEKHCWGEGVVGFHQPPKLSFLLHFWATFWPVGFH